MSTRGLYTFKDKRGAYNVYKHMDNYPSGAAQAIKAALAVAWPLPRFEADEFAAAFVAANKTQPGGVRLVESGAPDDVASSDIEYRYEITFDEDWIVVKAFSTDYAWEKDQEDEIKVIFYGSLEQFEAEFNEELVR